MQSRPLIIITTRLPPQICGIGTFSWQLERYWPDRKSANRFLVVDGASESQRVLERTRISEFGNDWKALGRALDEAGPVDVLLHYAGRGYQRYGCPLGLPPVLQKWRTKFSGARLAIFFHELPGYFPITSRHYWLNVCSRGIARKLANLADLLITNTEEHVRTLQKISGRTDISSLPVGSNIENTTTDNQNAEQAEFVIFGLPFSRWQTLEVFDSHIRAWQESGILTKLHLIGPPDGKFDLRSERLIREYPQPATVIRHGEIPAADVSRVLSETRFALTTANDLTWGKSTTFMAYLAHGCVVVADADSDREPLSWTIRPKEVETLSTDELRSRANAGRRWYETHAGWKVLAAKISELIGNLPGRVL